MRRIASTLLLVRVSTHLSSCCWSDTLHTETAAFAQQCVIPRIISRFLFGTPSHYCRHVIFSRTRSQYFCTMTRAACPTLSLRRYSSSVNFSVLRASRVPRITVTSNVVSDLYPEVSSEEPYNGIQRRDY